MGAVHCFVNVAVIALLVALVGVWLHDGAEPVTEVPLPAPQPEPHTRDACSGGEGAESKTQREERDGDENVRTMDAHILDESRSSPTPSPSIPLHSSPPNFESNDASPPLIPPQPLPPVPPPTSVFCWGSTHADRLCHFRNLYYLPSADEFVFLHADENQNARDHCERCFHGSGEQQHESFSNGNEKNEDCLSCENSDGDEHLHLHSPLSDKCHSKNSEHSEDYPQANGCHMGDCHGDNRHRDGDHLGASVLLGVPRVRHSPALVDISSVADHSIAHFDYVDFARAPTEFLSARVVERRALIVRRFHPDNLMHVVHDDLLPIYRMLQVMEEAAMAWRGGNEEGMREGGKAWGQLVFIDDREPGLHANLYRVFSSHMPLYKSDLRSSPVPILFRSVLVGLSKHTTWYQYGFTEGRPQGPINGSQVTRSDIRRFCRFFAGALNVSLPARSSEAGDGAGAEQQRVAVLVRREDTRLILNELELSMAVARHLQARVVTVAMETHSIAEMIEIISTADLMIGMHGSLLILAMFLPPHAALVELFPYAVDPSRYTPYRTLAALCRLRYAAWRCADRSRSVAHPERAPEHGGLEHLSAERRREIEESAEVPPHRCCADAEWLYRANQDTTVDVEAIVQLIDSLPEPSIADRSVKDWPEGLVPSRVRNLECSAQPAGTDKGAALFVSWQAPINLDYLPGIKAVGGVRYEVWIQEEGLDDYQAFMLSTTSHRFGSGLLRASTDYHIWVRCVIGGDRAVGPFNAPLSCRTTP